MDAKTVKKDQNTLKTDKSNTSNPSSIIDVLAGKYKDKIPISDNVKKLKEDILITTLQDKYR